MLKTQSRGAIAMLYVLTPAGRYSPFSSSLPHLLRLVYNALAEAQGPITPEDVSTRLGGDRNAAYSADNVQTALRQLVALNYVDELALAPASMSAVFIQPPAVEVNWACVATPSDALEDRLLMFLQTEALAWVKRNPGHSVSEICFALEDIRDGVNRALSLERCRDALDLLRIQQGCVRTCSNDDTYQAVIV
jgi:hypothetical protein